MQYKLSQRGSGNEKSKLAARKETPAYLLSFRPSLHIETFRLVVIVTRTKSSLHTSAPVVQVKIR